MFGVRWLHLCRKIQHYWSKAIDNPSRRVWSGLVFEQLCRDHTDQIKAKLGISGVLTEEYAWSSKGDEDLRNKIESFRKKYGNKQVHSISAGNNIWS